MQHISCVYCPYNNWWHGWGSIHSRLIVNQSPSCSTEWFPLLSAHQRRYSFKFDKRWFTIHICLCYLERGSCHLKLARIRNSTSRLSLVLFQLVFNSNLFLLAASLLSSWWHWSFSKDVSTSWGQRRNHWTSSLCIAPPHKPSPRCRSCSECCSSAFRTTCADQTAESSISMAIGQSGCWFDKELGPMSCQSWTNKRARRVA